jgi:urease accessory protein
MRVISVLSAESLKKSQECDHVLLDYYDRRRRRFVLMTEGRREILLDLPQAVHLRDGDGLELEDGSIVRVRAKAEPLLEIQAPDEVLLRIAWHLGNRHLPVQILHQSIRVLEDHVIAEMVKQLGGEIRRLEEAFDPEPGAYAASGHTHAHEHG